MTGKRSLKDTTLINSTINIPRNSKKAVVLLFTDDTADREAYNYLNIESAEITIEGIVPNSIYSKGLVKNRFYEEAKRLFEITQTNSHMSEKLFYKNAFALVVDLRNTKDPNAFGNGYRIVNTQSGVVLAISKKVTAKDVKCHTFVVLDATVNMRDLDAVGVSY
jgi:hypothetical protein